MAKSESLIFSLFTTRPLSSETDAADILRRLCSYPELVPQRWGVYDPISNAFECERIDQIVSEAWSQIIRDFYWKRSKPSVCGGISFGDASEHGQVDFSSSTVSESITRETVNYLRSEAVHLNADIGYVEVSWPGGWAPSGGIESSCPPSMPREKFENMWEDYFTRQIIKSLPQVAWATVFGPPYVRMFGRERLLSAPVAVAEEIGQDMIYMQLTRTPAEIIADLPAYFDLRRRVKNHIGPDAFFDPMKGKGPYRVPTFALEPWPKPKPLGYIDGFPVVGLVCGHPVVQTDEGTRILSDTRWVAGEERSTEG